MRTSSRQVRSFFWALLVFFVGLHLFHGLFRVADPDEFQALTNAFDASRGLIPYVDFWDNHGPLMIWILQPTLSLWSGGHELIYWLRGVAWLNTMMVVGIVFWLARRLHPLQPAAPWIAAVFLLAAPPFLSKAIEIRGDNPANLLTTLALGFLILGLQTRKWIAFFVVGVCLGLLAGFTLKAVIATAALALFYLGWHLRAKRVPQFAGIAALAVGAIIPLFVISLVLVSNGSFSSFLNCYLGGNVDRNSGGFSSSEFLEVYKKAPVWALLATLVVCASLWRWVRRRAAGIEIGLLAMSLFYVAQFLLALPTKNMQSLLPLYVPLALLSCHVFSDVVYRNRNWFRSNRVALVGAMLLPLFLLRDIDSYSNLRNHGLPKQVAFANQTLKRLTHQDYIFDPSGLVFLKPKPGSFHVLVTFIREMHQSGVIDLQIPELLKESQVRAIVFDRRTKDLRTSDVAYITANYTPILKGPDCFLLALTASGTTGTTAIAANTPIAFSDWTEELFEKSRRPTMPYDPPEWYRAAGF